MRRQTLRLAVAIPVLILLVPSAFSKSYRASRFDVALGVQPGGDVLVTETIDFRFEGGPYTYVSREVPLKESDGFDQFQAYMDGQELWIGAGEMPGLELERRSNAVRLTWHFQPISDTLRTFTVKYRARGAVRRQDGIDLLLWKAIPSDHGYRIDSGRVTVSYPPGVRLSGEPKANRKAGISTSAQTIIYDAGQLNKEHGFTVNVPFPQGSIMAQTPLWQREAHRRRAEFWDAAKIAMAVVVPLFLIGILLIVRLSSGSSPRPPFDPNLVTSPPDDLPPALVGVLRGSWADWRVGLATLIDLGQRGFLEIEALPKRWWAVREFKLRRKGDPGTLTHSERVLLRLVFGIAEPHAPAVPLRKAQRQILRRWRHFTEVVKAEARAAGLLDADRESARRKWAGIGGMMMLLALAATGAWLVATVPQGQLTPIVVGAAAGLASFILGLVVLITGANRTRLTDGALARKQRWDVFRKHLKQLVSKKEPLHPDWLASYLPYAVVLGLGNEWAKAFKDQGMSAQLAWLVGTDQFDGSDLAVLVAVLGSSGAGSSTGGGGAASAGGGGGSSGAG